MNKFKMCFILDKIEVMKMKKMMMIVAAGLFASCMQAATVNWAAEPSNSQLGGANSASGTYYIFALGGASATFGNGGFDIATLILTAEAGGGSFTQATAGNFSLNPGSYWDAGEIVVSWSNTSGTADTASSSIINQWWAVVFVDDASTGWYGVDVFQVSGQNAQTGAFEVLAESLDVAQYTTVPEPTSMALLALGVAAVGLRRKFRK